VQVWQVVATTRDTSRSKPLADLDGSGIQQLTGGWLRQQG
jgi:hypothetical protein